MERSCTLSSEYAIYLFCNIAYYLEKYFDVLPLVWYIIRTVDVEIHYNVVTHIEHE